jgi:hypothetical protein
MPVRRLAPARAGVFGQFGKGGIVKIFAYAALTLALFGCEAEAPVPMNAPAFVGASVMALRPVETRGEALSAGPGAAFDLADLFVDDNLCYYARTNGAIAPLTGSTGAQICEQDLAMPVFVAPVSG